MAKKQTIVQKKMHKVMTEFKEGTLKSGSGAKVTSRKQAVAIGLSEARARGAKIPKSMHMAARSVHEVVDRTKEIELGKGTVAGMSDHKHYKGAKVGSTEDHNFVKSKDVDFSSGEWQ